MMKIALLLTILLPLMLSSTAAQPRKDRPPPYAAEPFLNAAPVVAGVVRRLVINPQGEVDGLLLEDGTLAKLPPHMADELTAAVKPGDTVSVRGLRESSGSVKALIITNEGSKRAVIEHPPVPGVATMPKHLRFATLGRLQASGKVERAIYGRNGEITGVMLDDGTVVRVPKHAVHQLAAQLQPGQTIAVEGLGTRNEYGRALEAIAIGATLQTLQPIYQQAVRP